MTIFNRQIEKAPKVLEALVSAPSTGPGNGAFYTKDVGGIIEGFYVDSNGVEVQITTNGELNLGAVGEINTASVVGAGEDIFKEKSGTNLVFRSIRGDGSTIAVSTVGDDIVISAPVIGEDNQAANLPGGTGIFAQKNGEVLEFKSLIAGTNITLTPEANTITIDASAAGEANSGTNVGTGNEIFKEKSGTNLVFRSLTAGSGIVLTNSIDGNEIEIAATGGGGGSAITVRDEGSIIDTGLTELNFTGAGVTASQTSPGIIEVSIAGGGGSGTDESVKVSSNDTTAGYLTDKLVAGTNITLTPNNDGGNETITISASGGGSGEANTASNLGGGEGLFTTKSGVDLPFKSLVAGTNVSLSSSATEITINATGGSGEINTASNLGLTGEGVFSTKVGADLQFKKLKAGTNVTLSSDADSITINSSGGGGSLAVEDDGLEILAVASRLNFTGAGVTVTDAGAGEATINIPGGGSSVDEFRFTLPAAADLATRILSVSGLPPGWTLDTADAAAETEFGSSAETLVIQWDVGLGTKIAKVSMWQKNTAGPVATQGIQKIDLSGTADEKTKTDGTKSAVYLTGKGLQTTRDLEVFVKLV